MFLKKLQQNNTQKNKYFFRKWYHLEKNMKFLLQFYLQNKWLKECD